MKTAAKIHTSSVLSALLGMILLGGCQMMGGGGDSAELQEALIRKVDKGDLVEEVTESGHLAPAFEVDIKSKVSGEVLSVAVTEGQSVEKGDLLLTVMDVDYRRDVALSEVSVEEARINMANAELELLRKTQALEARGISEFEHDVAKQQVELAKVRVKSAEVQLGASRDRLGYCRISAPMAGTVIARNVEPGEIITAGVTATVNGVAQLTIARLDKLLMELDLNQVDVGRVEVGMDARILLDAFPGEELMGKVTQIAVAAHTDASKGVDVFTVKVEIDASQAKVKVKPGMTAEVRILVGKYPDVVKVPVETVFEEDGKQYLYVVKPDPTAKGAIKKKKEKVEVQIGHRGGRELEITSGVVAGDEIYAQADVKSAQINPDDD